MKIYIRHAEKLYNNGKSKSYKFDPGITEEGFQNSIKLSRFLIRKYGKPEFIICSPYLRTRQTAYAMAKEKKIPIIINPKLSEYLGNHYDKKLDVHKETLKYQPPHPEKFSDLKKRIIEYSKYIKSINNKNIWIITHGLIIKEFAKLHKRKLPNHIRNLSYYLFKE